MFSSLPEQFRDVARFENFSNTGNNFSTLLTHGISKHEKIKLYMNYNDFVPRWVRPQWKPGWEALFWEALVLMNCDKLTSQQILT